jgi:hypothetical protein
MEIMRILILVACGDVLLDKFFFLDCLTLKTEELQFFKMLRYTYPVTHCHVSEDFNLSTTVITADCICGSYRQEKWGSTV